MSRKKHPGGTGAYDCKDPGFSDRQRDDLLTLARSWNLKKLDETALWAGVYEAASTYNAAKEVADRSSAGPMRKNLSKGVSLARKLRDHLCRMDGNSLQLVNGGVSDADRLLQALEQALALVEERCPKRGRRPADEQLHLVVQLKQLMEACSSMSLSPPSDGNFDSLVEAVFNLLNLNGSDVHSWVDKALSREWYVEEAPGVRYFDPEAKSLEK